MSRISAGLGWAIQNKVRVASLAVVAALLFTTTAPLAIVAAETDGANTNHDGSVSSTEVSQALRSVPGILNSSDQVSASADADSAATTNVMGNVVDEPKEATEGVTFGAENGPKLDVTLPNAEEASEAKKVAPGVIGYDSGDGSANAVQTTEDGNVRMLTIIDNPSAPTEYDYKVSVPAGGSVQLSQDGGAKITDGSGQIISAVTTPWAKDATGKTIATWFTSDGQTLTQHVQHNIPGVVYPVSADPFFLVFSGAVFWWAVQRCGAGGMIGAVFAYIGGERSRRAIAAAGAAGCIAGFVGGWSKLKWLVYVVKVV